MPCIVSGQHVSRFSRPVAFEICIYYIIIIIIIYFIGTDQSKFGYIILLLFVLLFSLSNY